MQVKRLDVGRLDAPKRTQQGFIAAPAHLTRAGVFTYYNPDGSLRREYRPTSEVFKADSLASLHAAPVTDRHPPEMVTAENRGKYDMGNVGDNIVRDGARVAAVVYVKDGKLISSIERGDGSEVSCGYNCDLDMTPGVVPAGEPDAGEKYDAVQRNITYNHLAVVPTGRAGSSVRLHLDAAGHVLLPQENDNMTKERIDGTDYDVGTDPHKAAVARRDEAEKKAKAELEGQRARADKAEVDLAAAKKELAELPARIEAQAKARADLLDGARQVLGADAKFDGMDEAAIRRAVAQTVLGPEAKLDGRSPDYISALFDMAVSQGVRRDDSAEGLAKVRADAAHAASAGGDPVEAARRRLDEHTQNAWKTVKA